VKTKRSILAQTPHASCQAWWWWDEDLGFFFSNSLGTLQSVSQE